nr:hypothetical protein [Pseudomonas oryzicola]
MSKPMKRSAFFLSAAVAGLFAVYAPSSWSGDTTRQPANAENAKGAQGMDHGAMKGMDHGNMKGMNHDAMQGMDHGNMKGMNHDAMQGMDHGNMQGMNHDAMQGMDHGTMQGMDHSKMMESHGSDKAKAGKDAQ